MKCDVNNLVKSTTYKLTITLLISIWFVVGLSPFYLKYQVDFVAFYGAGAKILSLISPYGAYQTAYGASVFQSFPWVSYFFAPLSIMKVEHAWIVYVAINAGLLLLITIILIRSEEVKLTPLEYTYIYACILAISYFCLEFGQITIIQLLFLLLIIRALQCRNEVTAGALIPLAIIKPHLIIWFLLFVVARKSRRFIISSILSTLFISLITLIILPSWPADMVSTIITGHVESTMNSWEFSTLPGLLGLDPIYGFLVTPISILPLILIHRRIQYFSLKSQLWIGLAFSLATSPYAFPYDLPIMIPSLVWLLNQCLH